MFPGYYHFYVYSDLDVSHCIYYSSKVFTGRGGRFVQLEDTIKGFQEILSGKLDSLPEGAFYMAGNIDEVKETAAKMATAWATDRWTQFFCDHFSKKC